MPVTVNDLNINVLTYMEALKKIVDKINEIIEVVNIKNGVGADISDKINIVDVVVNDFQGSDGNLYHYDINVEDTLEDKENYLIFLYNDSQGVMIPLVNKLVYGNVLEFVDSSNYDEEFWDDCMFIGVKLF